MHSPVDSVESRVTSSAVGRRRFLGALAAVSAVLMASCQSAAPASPTATSAKPAASGAGASSATQPTTAAQPAANAPAPASGQTVTIQEWFDLGSSMAKHIEDVANRFHQANPTITVHPTTVPTADMATKLSTAIAGGKPPQLAYIGPPALFASLIQANQLEPLDTYDKTLATLDWLKPIKDAANQNGHFYSLPVNSGDLGFYYNADLYAKADLDPEKPPVTWDDLLQYGEKIAQVSPGQTWGHYVANKPISWASSQIWSAYLWQAGGDFLTPDNKQAAFNSPEGVKALQFWVDLVNKYKVTPLKAIDNIVMGNDFSTGDVGSMTLYPIWVIQAEQMKFKVRTATLPKDKQAATPLGMGHMVIPKVADYKQEAWTYLNWLKEPVNAIFWCSGLGNLPTRPSITKDPAWDAYVKKHPLVQPFVEAQSSARLYYLGPGADPMYVVIAQAIESALYQRQTPKQALDDAATKVNDILKKAQSGQ